MLNVGHTHMKITVLVAGVLVATCVSCRHMAQPVVQAMGEALSPARQVTMSSLAFHLATSRWPTNVVELENFVDSRGYGLTYSGCTNLTVSAERGGRMKIEYDMIGSASGHLAIAIGAPKSVLTSDQISAEEVDLMIESVLKTRETSTDKGNPSPTKELNSTNQSAL